MTTRTERIAAFAAFPEHLRVAAVAAADRPSKQGEWGPTEVVRHLIAVEDEVHVHRLRDVATTEDPQWTWTEPGLALGYDEATLGDLLDAFAVIRSATVSLYQALDDVGWNRSGTHSTFGRLDVDGLLQLAVDHDTEHLRALNP